MCDFCNNTGYIKGKQCPHCMDAQKMVKAIKNAIVDLRKKGDIRTSENLKKVYAFLPEYPVMAIMEAQALNMQDDFIELLCDSFQSKMLGHSVLDTVEVKHG